MKGIHHYWMLRIFSSARGLVVVQTDNYKASGSSFTGTYGISIPTMSKIFNSLNSTFNDVVEDSSKDDARYCVHRRENGVVA
jgi:hypothetical protein